LFRPDDPLAPPKPAFDEPWQAQALALADAMVQAGHFTAAEWAEALGAALKDAEAQGAPDTLDVYYTGVVSALEKLSGEKAGISTQARVRRRREWEEAYHRTPHGKPVVL
jgi:nitrile hydratase accessory protein